MKEFLWAVFFGLLSFARSEEQYAKYDAAAIQRFDDELRRLGVTLPLLIQPEQPAVERSPPKVTAPAGDFKGYWTESQFGRPIATFEGIPYAQPPVGPLRFKLAQPLPPLTAFNASKPGGICTQRSVILLSREITGQEDCLYLNIHVPEKVQRTESERLPVMFYVHGGGFVEGHGDALKSSILLDKDVVLVTFNYRLGPLGFLTSEDGVIPGNLGLKDQVAALRWVNQNIAAFGGNPKLVTVFGHSAGGGSTDFLMLTPLTRGLIHRVIPMSGFSMAGWALAPPGESRNVRQKAATHLNCPFEPSADFLACLRTKTHEEITAADYVFPVWGKMPHIPCKPVVEGNLSGAFLPYHPEKMLTDHLYNDIPYMSGLTSEEGSLVAPGFFNNETLLRDFDANFTEIASQSLFLFSSKERNREITDSLRRAYFGTQPLQRSQLLQASNLYTDVFFLWPLMKSLTYRMKTALEPSYVYYFNHVGSRSLLEIFGYKEKYGVSHGDELLYLFPLFGTPTPSDVQLSIIFTDLLTSFARDGVPTSSLLKTQWSPVASKNGIEYLHIKSPVDIQMKKGLLTERWTLLKRLFENPDVHEHEL